MMEQEFQDKFQQLTMEVDLMNIYFLVFINLDMNKELIKFTSKMQVNVLK